MMRMWEGEMQLRTKRATVQTQRSDHKSPCRGWARWVIGKVPGAAF